MDFVGKMPNKLLDSGAIIVAEKDSLKLSEIQQSAGLLCPHIEHYV